MKKRTFNVFFQLNLITNLNKLFRLLLLTAIGICFCTEPAFAMDLNTHPDSTLPFTAEELKAASEISPEELMRQMAENAAEIDKLERDLECDSSDYGKAPRQKKTQSRPKANKTSKSKNCGLKCVSQGSLLAHKRTHTGKKPFKCSTCGRGFAQRGNLKTHVRTHTGEKPYVCDTCGRRFAHGSNLSVHMHTHTGEKPYGCGHFDCKKAFANPTSRRKHMKTCPCRPDAPSTDDADESADAGSGTESDLKTGT